jgi:hypothetical protein
VLLADSLVRAQYSRKCFGIITLSTKVFSGRRILRHGFEFEDASSFSQRLGLLRSEVCLCGMQPAVHQNVDAVSRGLVSGKLAGWYGSQSVQLSRHDAGNRFGIVDFLPV